MCSDAKSLALAWKEKRYGEKECEPGEWQFGKYQRNGLSSRENPKCFFSPTFRVTMLSAAVLPALTVSLPLPFPKPHSRFQLNSRILILLNTHLFLSSQSLSVRLYACGKGPEVVLTDLIFLKIWTVECWERNLVFLVVRWEIRVRYIEFLMYFLFQELRQPGEGGEQSWLETWV